MTAAVIGAVGAVATTTGATTATTTMVTTMVTTMMATTAVIGVGRVAVTTEHRRDTCQASVAIPPGE